MSITVKDILDEIRREGANVSFEKITYLGLLLERHRRDRYDDPIYEQLFFPAGWLELKLNELEFEAIVALLADLLSGHPNLASTAAFALGKACSNESARHLAAALHKYWQSDDRTTYQLLVALGNYGMEREADLVKQIAREGLELSREFASDIVRVRGL